jgi:large subunit ribosomal protein L2
LSKFIDCNRIINGNKKIKTSYSWNKIQIVSTFGEITKTTPEKSLLVRFKKSGGRNNHGRITQRSEAADIKEDIELLILKEINMEFLQKFFL